MINLFYWSVIIFIVMGALMHLMKNNRFCKNIVAIIYMVMGFLCMIPIIIDFTKQSYPLAYSEEYVINNGIIDANEVENIGVILEGSNVEQYFVCNRSTIAYISLYMYTYERNNTSSIHVELKDVTDNIIIDEWDVDTIDIKGDAYQVFAIENPFAYDLYGHDCVIIISSDTTDSDNAVTIKKQKQEYDSTKLVVGDVKQEGNLIFTVVGYGQSTSKEWTRIALCIILLLVTEFILYVKCRRKDD